MEQIEGEKEWFKCESVRMEGRRRECWRSLSGCAHMHTGLHLCVLK